MCTLIALDGLAALWAKVGGRCEPLVDAERVEEMLTRQPAHTLACERTQQFEDRVTIDAWCMRVL